MKGLQINLNMMAMRTGYDMIENRCNVCKENIRFQEKVTYIERESSENESRQRCVSATTGQIPNRL